jgi:HK97 family phage major capsid protein
MTTQDAQRRQPATAENPAGVRYREVIVSRRNGEEMEDAQDMAPVAMALSSESPVERYDWRTGEYYMEVLDHSPGAIDLSYARDGLPFCLDHTLSAQIGIIDGVAIGDDRVMRGVARPGSHPEAEWVFKDMRDGIRKKVSIGYWPGEAYTQTKDAAGTITRRYTGWTLYEASSVAVPADYSVGVGRSASGAPLDQSAGVGPALSTESKMAGEIQSERGVALTPDTRAAELAALARDGGMPEKAAEWIVNGVTVDAARTEVLATLRAAAETRAPMSSAAPVVEVGRDRAADKPWNDDGADFFRAVVSAGRGGNVDVRLAASRAQNTLMGEEGGFAVPAPVVQNFLEATMTGGEILSRVSTRPVTTGNSYVETLVKEEARTNGARNGGVRGYWLAEDGTYVESQAATRQLDLKLQKLGALVKLTEEQIEDGPALVSFLNEQVPEELRFVAEQAVWEGDGTGKPLGAMSSGALVSVAIESGQTIANTAGHIWQNAAKMYARMPARMLDGAAFFINQQLWAKILTSTAGTAGASHPMFTAPGNLSAFPNGAIYGKPIVPVEYASAEGTVGDFVFANFADYLLIAKGGIKQATSLHVEFTRDRQLMKFTWRVNGAPRTRVPLTPFKGSDTMSPYIALAARS